MPASEITATSLVPPPMSTIMFPEGSVMGRPAPMAAAIGCSIKYTSRAPALSAAAPPPAALGRPAPGPPLDLGDARGDADDDPRLHQRRPVVRGADEVAQHRG